MGSILMLILFIIAVIIYMKLIKPKDDIPQDYNENQVEDQNVPPFWPHLADKIKGREEDEEETHSYDDFLEY